MNFFENRMSKQSREVRSGERDFARQPTRSCDWWAKNCVGRVDKAAPSVHDDTTCVRISTESDIIL